MVVLEEEKLEEVKLEVIASEDPLDMADRPLDKNGGENEFYHTALKCQVDFDFFYEGHVPTKIIVPPI